MKNNASVCLLSAVSLTLLAESVLAQQVPIPKTAVEVPGPAPGTAMTKAYVQTVGRMAYLWGWPLVNMANRVAAMAKVPEPGLLGGVLPQPSCKADRLHRTGRALHHVPEPRRCVRHWMVRSR
jgi:hypothetical protein